LTSGGLRPSAGLASILARYRCRGCKSGDEALAAELGTLEMIQLPLETEPAALDEIEHDH